MVLMNFADSYSVNDTTTATNDKKDLVSKITPNDKESHNVSTTTINSIGTLPSYDKNNSVLADSKEKVSNEDDIPPREKWGSKWEFLLSCVGLSVGVGNIWRFPYKAYQNGGGAFLIPYIIMLLLAGKPMYFMELAISQYAGRGPLHIWRCLPIAKGIGYGMIALSLIVAIYYNVIMAYTLFYIFASFQSEVPWKKCNPEWADMTTCIDNIGKNRSNEFNSTVVQTSTDQYWNRYVLNITPGISNIGQIQWPLCLCLLLSWIIVCACLIKGVKSSGKVVYFTATFPYVILLILLIFGLTLDGSGTGIRYFFEPDWPKLLEIEVWKEAASQMFYSLGIAFGGLHVFGSYCEFRHPIYRDAMIVSILDTVTSIIGGVAIFSVLGNMAHTAGVDIKNVTSSGTGLAFVVYPEAIAKLPVPQLWAVLFFFMLFTLGLDSEFAMIETVLTSIFDEFPRLRKFKVIITIATSIICFFLALPCVTQGGQYVLNLMDYYTGSIGALFLAIFEVVAFMWIYGMNKFCDDLRFMLGFQPNIYWRSTWVFFCPLAICFITIYSLVKLQPTSYNNIYSYPVWADAIGWIIGFFVILQIPIWAIIVVFQQEGSTFISKVKMALQPDKEWGPSDPKERMKRLATSTVPLTTISASTLSGSASASNGIDNWASSNSYLSNV